MYPKIFISLVMIIFIINYVYSINQSIVKILIINFENQGDYQIDYLDDIIQSSLASFLKMVPSYQPISPVGFKQYLKDKQYELGDLQNKETLFKIAENFQASKIIRGKYHEQDEFIVIDFEVIDTNEKKVIYRGSKFGKGGLSIFNTLDTLVSSMVEDFTGIRLEFGTLELNTDLTCRLTVDNEDYGKTPLRTNIITGKHQVKVLYEAEDVRGIVYNNEININKNDQLKLDLTVFSRLNVTAEAPCQIFIDNKASGITPLSLSLLSGNQYRLKAVYHKQTENTDIIVGEKTISTDSGKPVNLDFLVYSSLQINFTKTTDASGDHIIGKINGEELKKFPAVLPRLEPGGYRLQLSVKDPLWKRNFQFYDQKLELQPNENKAIMIKKSEYKRLWGLAFIPGASQFYNHEPVKASLILASCLTGVMVAAFSPLISYLYYQYEYLPKAADWNARYTQSPYTAEELDTLYNTAGYLLQGFLISGLVTFGIIWLYSLIDGLVTTLHNYHLMNPELKLKKMNDKMSILPMIIINMEG